MKQEGVLNFELLERSLRKFVLGNRARSKLAPARTYLLNILHDVNSLATATVDAAQSELGRASEAVKEIVPQLETRRKTVAEVGLEIDTVIENTCVEIFNHNRSTIGSAIAQADDGAERYDVAYKGPWTAFQFAQELKEAMLSRIADAVIQCEDNARTYAARGVNTITQLGILHGGGTTAFERLQFRPAALFSRKRDALARQLDISIELQDFIDWPSLVWTEKFASAGMALTLATTVGSRWMDLHKWLDPAFMVARIVDNSDGFRQLLIPGVLISVMAAAATHILRRIPHAFPRHLAAKIATQSSDIDYVHVNSARITDRVRRVLRTPAEEARAALDHSVRDLQQRRDDMDKLWNESHAALKCYEKLVRASSAEAKTVRAINLEAPSSTSE